MSHTTRLMKFDMDCEAVIVQIRRHLAGLGVRVVRSFDLQSACASYPDLICPHHGDAPCDCQLVVLLAYGKEGPPASLVLHSHRGQTEIDLVESPDHKPGRELVYSIRMALVPENMYPVTLNEMADVS